MYHHYMLVLWKVSFTQSVRLSLVVPLYCSTHCSTASVLASVMSLSVVASPVMVVDVMVTRLERNSCRGMERMSRSSTRAAFTPVEHHREREGGREELKEASV